MAGGGPFQLRVSRPDRRDRLLLRDASAIHRLTTLGTAGEELGLDYNRRFTISKTRTHRPFRQGRMLHDLIPPC